LKTLSACGALQKTQLVGSNNSSTVTTEALASAYKAAYTPAAARGDRTKAARGDTTEAAEES